MDVVDVRLHVGFTPDLMLPEPALPNPALTTFAPAFPAKLVAWDTA